MADSSTNQNPENIQPGDVVWLKSDKNNQLPMVVEEIEQYVPHEDILIAVAQSHIPKIEIDPSAPYEVRCVWRDLYSQPHEKYFFLFDLTKIQPKTD